jgi:hypothetical protein
VFDIAQAMPSLPPIPQRIVGDIGLTLPLMLGAVHHYILTDATARHRDVDGLLAWRMLLDESNQRLRFGWCDLYTLPRTVCQFEVAHHSLPIFFSHRSSPSASRFPPSCWHRIQTSSSFIHLVIYGQSCGARHMMLDTRGR